MIRFFSNQLKEAEDMVMTIADKRFIFDQNIWREGKEYFKQNLCDSTVMAQLFPVENGQHEIVCYAWQDDEANRELRMLKELEEHGDALQFQDIFPEVQRVIVYGCNELAYQFVQYLNRQQVPVTVTGKYWDRLGYEVDHHIDPDSPNTLVIYAEGIVPQNGGFYQTVIRSISSEFECINKIYEANVVKGKIRDTEGDFEELLNQLKGRKVVVLGTNAQAQDAYDLLYCHGIDIECFAERNAKNSSLNRTLLGKRVKSISECFRGGDDLTFVDCRDKNSALGTECVEFFAYYGYRRNKKFFMLKDYSDIPYSNLVHVLCGKRVLLAGDERLCELLAYYLDSVEHGEVDVECVEISDLLMEEEEILCTVNPWYGGDVQSNLKVWSFNEKLKAGGIISYTDYFSTAKAFVIVDSYINQGVDKYSVKNLCPKGILLGRIPPVSGNLFFSGILDGHPDILKLDYNAVNHNLFFYCIRMANKPAGQVLLDLKQLLEEEFKCGNGTGNNICWDKFEDRVEALLSLKSSFTSQELFVIFHIAYVEMMRGEETTDISQKVIYWEPHHFPRNVEFSFLAKWLESEKVNGQTIYMHRDSIVRTGSWCKHCIMHYFKTSLQNFVIRGVAKELIESDDMPYQYWEEFHVRFEDLKLHPKQELLKICDKLGIPWSDTMLRTTRQGKAEDYYGVADFDLTPVFNKYETYLSEFDRFRIALLHGAYQKKYGYTYEDILKFSRRELQEMFLKNFRFQEELPFADEKERVSYFYHAYELLWQQLWEMRRHSVLDDIVPVFDTVEIGDSDMKSNLKKKEGRQNINELERLVQLIRNKKRLVLYGTGRDCEVLLRCLDELEQSELVFSDLKATYTDYMFHGKQVVKPQELCETYKEYTILITSSWYYKTIRQQLEEMGVSQDRMVCNTSQLW